MNFRALFLLGAGLAAAHPAADPYTRQASIDAIHYAFQLALNDSTDQIEGAATVAIRFVQRGTTSFWLDLASQANGKGMTVTDVTSAGVPVQFEHRGDRLRMTLGSAPAVNTPQSFVIRYRGVPMSGLFIGKNKFGDRVFMGLNWPDKARHGLPSARAGHVRTAGPPRAGVLQRAHRTVLVPKARQRGVRRHGRGNGARKRDLLR